MDVGTVFQSFTNGSIDAGEEILAQSGEKDKHIKIAIQPCFDAIIQVFACEHEDRIYEIAAGIIANFMLFDDTNEYCIDKLNIPDFIYECCSTINDPFTICELFRGLTNMVYTKKSEYLHSSIPTLASLIMYLAENSLSPKLLTHVLQLVYFIQVYSSTELVQDWNKYWNALSFYCYIIGTDIQSLDTDDSMLTEPEEPLYCTAQSLQNESIADCTGLEWLLLSIDRHTTAISASTVTSPSTATSLNICTSKPILTFIMHLLLSSSLQSWESSAHITTAQKKLGVVLSPTSSEKFLVLSILENIVSYRSERILQHEFADEIFCMAQGYSTVSKSVGSVSFLCTLLEIMEEAVLMRDKYGVFSAVYLVVQLFVKDNGDVVDITSFSFIESNMCTIFPALQNVIELLSDSDNTTWLLSTIDQDTDVGSLRTFLCSIKDSLLSGAQKEKITASVPKKSLLALHAHASHILSKLL